MTKKITNLNEQRRKIKPRSLEEVAKSAARRYLDSELVGSVEEPKGVASGKATKSGEFVHDDENEIDNEDNSNEK